MRHTNSQIREEDVSRNTYWSVHGSKKAIESVEGFKADTLKKERLKNRECRYCYYIRGGTGGRIGGAAITKANCGICGKDMMFSSTVTDKVCSDCSKKYHVCVYCGGDIAMSKSRGKYKLPA